MEDRKYYGLNTIISKEKLREFDFSKNKPDKLILGSVGSGMSFEAKREILNNFINKK